MHGHYCNFVLVALSGGRSPQILSCDFFLCLGLCGKYFPITKSRGPPLPFLGVSSETENLILFRTRNC